MDIEKLKQERINKAIEQEENDNYNYNLKLKKEEKEGCFKYDKSIFAHRKTKCSYKSAVKYIKKYYPEIKLSKKKITELIKASNIIKLNGYSSIGYQSNNSFSGFSRVSYELIEMDSIDKWSVNYIYEVINNV